MADTNRRSSTMANCIRCRAGVAVFSVAALFVYGSYSGLGSSL